jgi:hypothetical protein
MPIPRTTRYLGVILLVPALAGCSSLSRAPLSPDPSYESQRLAGSSGLSIEGYSSPDGVFHAFQGKAHWVGAGRDSLELRGRRKPAVPGAEPSGDPEDKQAVTLRLARSDVTTLLYRTNDPSKTGVLGLGIVTALLFTGTVLLFIAIVLSEGTD